MILHCGLLLLLLNCARTINFEEDDGTITKFGERFSYWPSVHNAAKLIHLRKREVKEQEGPSEGGTIENSHLQSQPKALEQPLQSLPLEHEASENVKPSAAVPPSEKSKPKASEPVINPVNGSSVNPEQPKVTDNITSNKNEIAAQPTVVANSTKVKNNASAVSTDPVTLDINSPGVVKRALIVFGGFALMAITYFIFWRKKKNNSDSKNAYNASDANQFRYGVLLSEDRRDNMELSQMPLTMDSDDDDDEDLEIFDLEQKKKSLSYVNLQTNDEDVVFDSQHKESDRDNLLLDIEDRQTDTLINWSRDNGNKSIL